MLIARRQCHSTQVTINRGLMLFIEWATSMMLFMLEGWWSQPHRKLWEVARHQTSPKFPYEVMTASPLASITLCYLPIATKLTFCLGKHNLKGANENVKGCDHRQKLERGKSPVVSGLPLCPP